MAKSSTFEDNFDLAHQTLPQLACNSVLIVAYLAFQERVLCIYRQKCEGHAIKSIFRQMQFLQFAMLVVITSEYIIFYGVDDQSEVIDRPENVVCESLIIILNVLQNLIFFKFMFKFQKVEIELHAFYKDFTVTQVLE